MPYLTDEDDDALEKKRRREEERRSTRWKKIYYYWQRNQLLCIISICWTLCTKKYLSAPQHHHCHFTINKTASEEAPYLYYKSVYDLSFFFLKAFDLVGWFSFCGKEEDITITFRHQIRSPLVTTLLRWLIIWLVQYLFTSAIHHLFAVIKYIAVVVIIA